MRASELHTQHHRFTSEPKDNNDVSENFAPYVDKVKFFLKLLTAKQLP